MPTFSQQKCRSMNFARRTESTELTCPLYADSFRFYEYDLRLLCCYYCYVSVFGRFVNAIDSHISHPAFDNNEYLVG